MERPIDKMIREAQARGEFDNLPGKGKPQKLDDDSGIPAELRLGYSVLKSGGYVPPEVQWLRDIETLREELESCSDEKRRDEIIKEIRDKRLKVDLFLEDLRRNR